MSETSLRAALCGVIVLGMKMLWKRTNKDLAVPASLAPRAGWRSTVRDGLVHWERLFRGRWIDVGHVSAGWYDHVRQTAGEAATATPGCPHGFDPQGPVGIDCPDCWAVLS